MTKFGSFGQFQTYAARHRTNAGGLSRRHKKTAAIAGGRSSHGDQTDQRIT
jgi:hypothetical protein